MGVWAEPFTPLACRRSSTCSGPVRAGRHYVQHLLGLELNQSERSTARWMRSSSSRRRSRSFRRARSRRASSRPRSWKRCSTISGMRGGRPSSCRSTSRSRTARLRTRGEIRVGFDLGGTKDAVQQGPGADCLQRPLALPLSAAAQAWRSASRQTGRKFTQHSSCSQCPHRFPYRKEQRSRPWQND